MTKRLGNPTDFESFLTWEALTDVLSYDRATGEFRWVKSARAGWVGRIAGHIDLTRGGYREIRINGRLYRTARLAWLHETKEWPKGVVDHKRKWMAHAHCDNKKVHLGIFATLDEARAARARFDEKYRGEFVSNRKSHPARSK
jgi:hypothetical protein